MANIKIDTYNCRGLASKEKRKKIFTHFKKSNSDIILLETHNIQEKEKLYKKEWEDNNSRMSYWNSQDDRSSGVAVLIKTNTTFK